MGTPYGKFQAGRFILARLLLQHVLRFGVFLWRVGVEEHQVLGVIAGEGFAFDDADADLVEETGDFQTPSLDLLADGPAAYLRIDSTERLKILGIPRNDHIGLGSCVAEQA